MKVQPKFNQKIVKFCVRFISAYTIAVLYIFYKTGQEPTTLTPAVFAFFGVELINLAVIKVKEVRTNKKVEIEDMRGE